MSLRSHEAIVKSIETDGFSGAMPDHQATRFVQDYAASNADAITAAWASEPLPPRTAAEHIAQRRAEMGEEKWRELNSEWD